MHWIILQLVTLALSIWISSPQELNSTLHFTEYGVPYAFVGEILTFTCQTERSNSIGWSSEQYIGVNRLDFASVESDGTTRPPTESGAVARLISSSRINETIILVSQLQITVLSAYQIASVTCHSIGIDIVNTSSFRIADNTSITCNVPRVCPGEKVSCACTTAHSTTLAWSSHQLIGGGGAEFVFNSSGRLLTRPNAPNTNTSAELSGTFNQNGVIILKSELSFVLLSTSSDIVLTCENVDHQNSYSLILPIYKGCGTGTISADPTTTMDESIHTTHNERLPTPSDAAGLSAGAIVAHVLLSVIVVIVLLLVLIFVVCKWKSLRNGKLFCGKHKETRNEDDCTRVRVRLTEDNVQESEPKSTSIQSYSKVHELMEEICNVEEQLRRLREEIKEKEQILKRKKDELEHTNKQMETKLQKRGSNEMEQQQEKKLHKLDTDKGQEDEKLHKWETGEIHLQVQESIANEGSAEANMNRVLKKDCLLVARTTNESIPA